MSELETVKHLTEIIARQAEIITKLYGVVGQLNAVVSFEKEVELIQAAAEKAMQEARTT